MGFFSKKPYRNNTGTTRGSHDISIFSRVCQGLGLGVFRVRVRIVRYGTFSRSHSLRLESPVGHTILQENLESAKSQG